MGRRTDLHEILKTALGSNYVYFQPPATVKLHYPCIIYERSAAQSIFANDKKYNNRIRYDVIVVDPNPDSDIPGKVAILPLSSFSRHYTMDNLNHDVYNIYY